MVAAALCWVLVSASPQDGAAHVAQAEALLAQGDLGGAAWNLRQAEWARPTAEVALALARVHERLKEDALATYYYRLYLRRSPQTPDALEVAELIAGYLATAEANGRGLLEVESPLPASVVIEGRAYPEAPVAVFLPPGDYLVEGELGGAPDKHPVAVLTGRTTTVGLLPPLAPPLMAPSYPPLVKAEEPRPELFSRTSFPRQPRPGWRRPSMVVLGASTVALAAGVALGGMARSAQSQAKDRAAHPIGDASVWAERARSRAVAANAFYALGAAGAVTGGVLFAFSLPEPGAKR